MGSFVVEASDDCIRWSGRASPHCRGEAKPGSSCRSSSRLSGGGCWISVMLLTLLFLCLGTNSALASVSEQINSLPVLDALNRSESPLSNGGKWSALNWATNSSGHATGQDTTTGWGPYDAFVSGSNGAYWNPSTFSDASGSAAAITMQANPEVAERYLSLWLDMPSPGSARSGYELRWTLNSSLTTYTAKLSKWSSGTQTVLASNAEVSIPNGTTLAISDTGGTVTAWKGSGGTLTSVLTATDSTYSSGYAGIEAAGNISRSQNFKAGSLNDPATAVNSLPVLDALNRSESPLSNGGKWSALSWATNSSGHATGQDTTSGWGPYDAFVSGSNGAYWNPSTFSDASGSAAAITMQANPGGAERFVSLWLDMPSPGSARSGYELRWTLNSSLTTYTAKLSKWSSGTQTVLASNAEVSIPNGTTLAISDTGGTVTAWKGSGGTLTSVLTATDSTYSSGYAGIEAAGNISRSQNFKAGSLNDPATAVNSLPVLDALNRSESPLSNGGKWSALSWATNSSGHATGQDTTSGWGPYDAFVSGSNGAYWNPSTFSDASGSAAAITMQANPGGAERFVSLWLDMPSPGSARSGYELRWTLNSSLTTYTAKLSK